MLRLLYGITEEKMHRDVDAVWVSLIHKLLVASPVDYGVVLGFDGVFDPQQGTLIAEDSQLIVPHQWVFKVCRDYPNLLPGPSINPFRGDALTILDECIEEGAVLIKWLPSAQGIDASAGQLSPFYKRLAQSGIPLLVHIGSERTFAEIQPGLNELRRLVPALEMGVIVIAAHSATPILMSRERDQVPELHEMLQRFPKLYVDNSGLNNPGRFRNVKRLVKDELIVARTLYGSD
jgi:predicted TIM-barrel fold metal-dependent hydrolase